MMKYIYIYISDQGLCCLLVNIIFKVLTFYLIYIIALVSYLKVFSAWRIACLVYLLSTSLARFR